MKENKKMGRPSRKPNDEFLHKLYVQMGMTSREISEEFQVSVHTVRGWIKQLNKKVEGNTKDGS